MYTLFREVNLPCYPAKKDLEDKLKNLRRIPLVMKYIFTGDPPYGQIMALDFKLYMRLEYVSTLFEFYAIQFAK